jgi:predicted nucleic-acid-binding protein
MIGLDTNVLVRYFAQDDEAQSAQASTLIEALTPENAGFISHIVLVELVWVMQSLYQADRATIAKIIQTILSVPSLHVDNSEVVQKALRVYAETSADFADCLIAKLADAASCKKTVTFDVKAAKHCGMYLIN